MKNKKKKKKRRIDKLNVTRKKKKNWKRRKKWVYIANTAETRKHSSFQCPVKHFTRIFYSSFHSSIHPLSSSTFFIPFLFFFFLISLVPSTEKTRSIDVTTSLRIVTFQSVFIRIDRSLLPLLPYFLFLPLLIISFLSISYTDSERTILLPMNFRFFFLFFFNLSTFAPIQRNVITFTLRPQKRSQSMIVYRLNQETV